MAIGFQVAVGGGKRVQTSRVRELGEQFTRIGRRVHEVWRGSPTMAAGVGLIFGNCYFNRSIPGQHF